jgi:glycosyltransferase involved in cell wall biosynthesis
MDKPLKILIISNTPWDDNNSFGSSFSNIFGGDKNYDIANIYCQPGLPNTKVCNRFFQITEKGILKSILGKQKNSGQEVFQTYKREDQTVIFSEKDQKVLNKLKIIRWQLFFWIRDLIWSTGKWKSEQLDKFISDFKPDLVFLPIYFSSYLNNIGLYTKALSKVKMLGYISDDCYSLQHFSLSPLFWLDRFIKRPYIKKAIDQCDILYTITDTQQKEYNTIFGEKCKILYKGGEFNDFTHKKTSLSNPIRLVYTGNLGSGRWRSLAAIADSLKIINKDGIKAQLYIYSQTPLKLSAMKKLEIEETSFFKGGIPSSRVKAVQRDADILIHVESFRSSERYSARLSFSTKIVDYLEAGRCILAVGWKRTGGIKYLQDNDAAIVITNVQDINEKVSRLLSNEQLILEYGRKGFECGKKNHQIENIRLNLEKDLLGLANAV